MDSDKRRVILARRAEGQSIREIAAAVEVSVGVVHKTLNPAAAPSAADPDGRIATLRLVPELGHRRSRTATSTSGPLPVQHHRQRPGQACALSRPDAPALDKDDVPD
ncbi:hypothetical protein NKH18_13370 [Streptomyces sp. M10(2022)]